MYHILIAEDDPQILSLVRRIVTISYGSVILNDVTNGRQALQFLEESEIDLLITDHDMPELTGLDLVHAIRQTNSTLPILMITGYTSIAKQAYRAGVNRFLSQPFTIDEMKRCLLDLLPGVASAPARENYRVILPGQGSILPGT